MDSHWRAQDATSTRRDAAPGRRSPKKTPMLGLTPRVFFKVDVPETPKQVSLATPKYTHLTHYAHVLHYHVRHGPLLCIVLTHYHVRHGTLLCIVLFVRAHKHSCTAFSLNIVALATVRWPICQHDLFEMDAMHGRPSCVGSGP